MLVIAAAIEASVIGSRGDTCCKVCLRGIICWTLVLCFFLRRPHAK